MSETSTEPTSGAAIERGNRKVREGLVVRDKTDTTVLVAVEDCVQHPLYGKTIRRTQKYKAHDEANSCAAGDRVLLIEARPLPGPKPWGVVAVLQSSTSG